MRFPTVAGCVGCVGNDLLGGFLWRDGSPADGTRPGFSKSKRKLHVVIQTNGIGRIVNLKKHTVPHNSKLAVRLAVPGPSPIPPRDDKSFIAGPKQSEAE